MALSNTCNQRLTIARTGELLPGAVAFARAAAAGFNGKSADRLD